MMAAKKSGARIARSMKKRADLPWPEGFRETAIRRGWFTRLCQCEPGLSLQTLSDRLGEPYASVAFWAKQLGYPFVLLKRGRKSEINWDGVDWSQKNCDLARQLGISGERVRQIRIARNIPPSSHYKGNGRKP